MNSETQKGRGQAVSCTTSHGTQGKLSFFPCDQPHRTYNLPPKGVGPLKRDISVLGGCQLDESENGLLKGNLRRETLDLMAFFQKNRNLHA